MKRQIEPLTLNLTDAAVRLGVSRRTLGRMLVNRELTYVRRGRRILIRIADIERWLTEHAVLSKEDARGERRRNLKIA